MAVNKQHIGQFSVRIDHTVGTSYKLIKVFRMRYYTLVFIGSRTQTVVQQICHRFHQIRSTVGKVDIFAFDRGTLITADLLECLITVLIQQRTPFGYIAMEILRLYKRFGFLIKLTV